MWRPAAAAAVLASLAAGTFAYAQQPPSASEPFQHWEPSAEDIGAFTDARIAGLKAGLRLSADQEKHWPAVERAIRGLAKDRFDRRMARRTEQPVRDPIERLRQRAQAMSTRANSLKQLADAAEPLYQSLDDAQKRRFTILARMTARRGAAGRWRLQGDTPPR